MCGTVELEMLHSIDRKAFRTFNRSRATHPTPPLTPTELTKLMIPQMHGNGKQTCTQTHTQFKGSAASALHTIANTISGTLLMQRMQYEH